MMTITVSQRYGLCSSCWLLKHSEREREEEERERQRLAKGAYVTGTLLHFHICHLLQLSTYTSSLLHPPTWTYGQNYLHYHFTSLQRKLLFFSRYNKHSLFISHS